jgi:drug/metabolite transporter (DMT)-like permease
VRPSRGNLLLLAAVVGVLFLVGLAVHGPPGGVVLLVVAAALLVLTARAWRHVRRQGRPLRLLVLAAVLVLALLKIAHRM